MNVSYFNKIAYLKLKINLLNPNILLKYDSYLHFFLLRPTASLIVKLCRSRNNNNINWNIFEYIFTNVIPYIILDIVCTSIDRYRLVI